MVILNRGGVLYCLDVADVGINSRQGEIIVAEAIGVSRQLKGFKNAEKLSIDLSKAFGHCAVFVDKVLMSGVTNKLDSVFIVYLSSKSGHRHRS